MVWCGLVWFGVVWCGLVWFGVVWCGVVWCGLVWFGVVWCGVVWWGVVQCGVWFEKVLYDMICGVVCRFYLLCSVVLTTIFQAITHHFILSSKKHPQTTITTTLAQEGDGKTDDNKASMLEELKEMDQQIDICNAQISELQQKLLDVDQGTACLIPA